MARVAQVPRADVARRVRARYDAAQNTQEHQKLWSMADGLSARAANDPATRKRLRERARYEAGNNSYCKGMSQCVANDLIGTGPRLQLRTKNRELNARVAKAFDRWTATIGLAEKLRTITKAKLIDGEAFAQFTFAKRVGPVPLDIKPIECDRVSTPYQAPSTGSEVDVDGIILDKFGDPVRYNVLKQHPGDQHYYGGVFDYTSVPAADMLHWFRVDRPGQYRGVPEITPAIPLYGLLRRYTLAVLAAAETAADFAAVLESELPADPSGDDDAEGTPFETIEIVKRMLMTLPNGYKLSQLKAEQPTATYASFKEEILCEIARCLQMPYNVAAGTSKGSNFSSGRLDHNVYYRQLGVDQYHLETVGLNPLLAVWLQGYRLAFDDVDAALASVERENDGYIEHAWFWDGSSAIDPQKEATAQQTRLQSHTTTLADEWGARGFDWREKLDQRAEEIAYAESLGLNIDITPNANVTQTTGPADGEADDEAPKKEAPRMAAGMKLTANAPNSEPASLKLAAVAPSDVLIEAAKGEGKLPTFDILGYTGAVMSADGFFYPIIVDLTGLKSAGQEIPALFHHDSTRVVGQTQSVTVGSEGARFKGSLTGDNADVQEITTHAKNGFKWQASIGAWVERREFLEPGKTATVNGREVRGPLIIAREATVREISFVPLGADGQTSAAVAASSSRGPISGAADMSFEEWLKAKGFDPVALSADSRAYLMAAFKAETAPPAPPPAAPPATPPAPTPVQAAAPPAENSLESVIAARRTEQARQAEITRLTAEAIDQRPTLIDTFEQLATAARDNPRTTINEFKMAIWQVRAEAGPAVHIVDHRQSRGPQIVIASLCRTGGLNNIEKHFDAKTLELSDRHFSRGLGVRDVLLICAQENGYTGGQWEEREILRAAFLKADGFSTLTIPGILSNVANKFLAEGFMGVEDGWRAIAKTRPVRDFKQTTAYSLTGDMTYRKVGAGGELEHATLGEEDYTNQADTYGRLMAITRKQIRNDDLGALTDVPKMLGRGAGLALATTFWTAFLANRDTFWATGNANVLTGGGSALAAAGLKASHEKFRKQTDPDGNPLGILPRILLVPPELEITAEELMTSAGFNTGGSATDTKVPNRNVWANKYRTVSSSYLSNANITGYSTTHWFQLADPRDLVTIEVVFLDGKETPTIETADADFETLGIKMRGFHDFGVNKQEPRASVRNAGA